MRDILNLRYNSNMTWKTKTSSDIEEKTFELIKSNKIRLY